MWAQNNLWVYVGIFVSGLMKLRFKNLYHNNFKQQFLVFNYEARTRHLRCRTRVGRGGTQRRARDAAAHVSGRVMPRGNVDFLADSRRCGFDSGRFALNRVDSGRIGKYRPKRPLRPKFKKKKKKRHRTHCLSKILNPTEGSLVSYSH